MAILKCPQCGNKVSDKAEKCPHCGKMVSDFLALENSYQEAINIFQSNSSTSPNPLYFSNSSLLIYWDNTLSFKAESIKKSMK